MKKSVRAFGNVVLLVLVVSLASSLIRTMPAADPRLIAWGELLIILLLLALIALLYFRYSSVRQRETIAFAKQLQAKYEAELRQAEAIRLRIEKNNAKLECERERLAAENFRLRIAEFEKESEALKEAISHSRQLAKPVVDAIRERIEMLNALLATQITDNALYAKPYEAWRNAILQDKEYFMNTTRLAFKASHPQLIAYFEEHGLTEAETNYVCLYAIGLRGKEVGEYMQLKRHYQISSAIRAKLGIDEHETNLGIYVRRLMAKL